jgi:hypothetical protein
MRRLCHQVDSVHVLLVPEKQVFLDPYLVGRYVNLDYEIGSLPYNSTVL